MANFMYSTYIVTWSLKKIYISMQMNNEYFKWYKFTQKWQMICYGKTGADPGVALPIKAVTILHCVQWAELTALTLAWHVMCKGGRGPSEILLASHSRVAAATQIWALKFGVGGPGPRAPLPPPPAPWSAPKTTLHDQYSTQQESRCLRERMVAVRRTEIQLPNKVFPPLVLSAAEINKTTCLSNG